MRQQSAFWGLTALVFCLSFKHIVQVWNQYEGIQQELAKNTSKTVQETLPNDPLRRQASAVLDHMNQQKVFETPLTTRESVLQHGFPINWKPCTLEDLVHSKNDRTLHLVVLGGSCSAWTPKNCSLLQSNSQYSRYGDFLQTFLNQDNENKHLSFQISNMAQGSTGSIYNGLTLDSVLDPTKTDILIWEFGLNDDWSINRLHLRALEFWLTRVDALFVSQPRPPILILVLYEAFWGNHPTREGLDGPWRGALPFLEDYSQQGWNLQVVTLGSTIPQDRATAVVNDTSLLLDDEHHPNCRTTQLIANLLRQAIYSNLANCNPEEYSTSISLPTTTSWDNPALLLRHDDDSDLSPPLQSLWKLLLDPQVRIGSWTPWTPKLENSSNLSLGNREELEHWRVAVTERTDPSRQDRKLGHVLNKCSSQWNRILLEEPTLEWLGLGKKVRQAAIGLEINGVQVSRPIVHNLDNHGYITVWVHVPSIVERAHQYTISLCNNDTTHTQVFLRQLVGVMAPRNDSRLRN